MDREADFFELFDTQRRIGRVEVLVRARHDRRLGEGLPKLFAALRNAPADGHVESFAHSIDRELSPIFVGRERETEDVLRRAELLGEDHAEGRNTQGATVVITGCPGSGKSAFLGHFARTFAKVDLTSTVLIPMECNHHDLTARNSKELRAQLAEVAIEKKERMHRTFQALLKEDHAGQAPP